MILSRHTTRSYRDLAKTLKSINRFSPRNGVVTLTMESEDKKERFRLELEPSEILSIVTQIPAAELMDKLGGVEATSAFVRSLKHALGIGPARTPLDAIKAAYAALSHPEVYSVHPVAASRITLQNAIEKSEGQADD